ncbi:MAG: hypothetical protein PHX25_04080 [Candidatus Pacebacteria bacterium]|nr:hypothetical protein [Candidatus Paceibacterota bacterium]
MKLQKGDVITFESGKIVVRSPGRGQTEFDDVFGIGVNLFKLKTIAEMFVSVAGLNGVSYVEEDRAFVTI